MSTPRVNWIILLLYLLAAIMIFSAALLSPEFRSLAYAPLREVILPPPEPVIITLLYSTEKEAWLNEVIIQMEKDHLEVDGRPIQVELKKMGSREIYLAVLEGKEQPDIISPASSLQISILQDLSSSKFGSPWVSLQNSSTCRSVFSTPLVLVAWKERADVLWGSQPGENLWQELHSALIDPRGWGAFGQPDWSYIKFGHTDPTKSNSGFMTILLMTYNYFGKTDRLTSQDILSNQDFQRWIMDFESAIADFGDSTGTYMRDIVAYGPSRYDIVAVYEASAIEQLENARGRYGELYVYYPPATILSDHPFCLLQAEWVSPEKARAAQVFIKYLLARPAQEIALKKYGYRPADPSISLDQSGSPFTRYAQNGLQVNLPPSVVLPPGNVLDTLLTFWIRNIQR